MNNPILLVILPISAGLFLYLSGKHISLKLSALIPLSLLAFSVYLFPAAEEKEILYTLMDVSLPFGMALRIDTLSGIMLIINNFLFLCMLVFSLDKKYMNRLFVFLFLSLEGLINGVFLSTDLFNIYILVEVSTIAVSILIMFRKDSQSTYDGMIYLLINMVAMAFFLFGTGYLYKMSGALDLLSIKSFVDTHPDKRAFILPFSFIFTAVCLKSAVMPLYSWLPKAHGALSAPSVVSAVLSGIFVKTGVYLLIRVQWIFSSAADIRQILILTGFITAFSGIAFAVSQTNIKLILAYHTISQVGLIITGLAGINQFNQAGGIYHIMAHAVFKSLFFLIAGLLISYYGTRNIAEMHGLWHINPLLSVFLLIAVLSITGAPFFSGGYSKYFISKGYESSPLNFLFSLINAGTMLSFIKFLKLIFSRPDKFCKELTLRNNEKVVLSVMCLSCVLLGTAGNQIMNLVYPQDLYYSYVQQLRKIPLYLMTYSASFVMYHFFIKDLAILSRIRRIDLSFNSMSIALVLFFLMTLSYMSITM